MFKPLWQYRNFIASSILGELRGRYARSRLGMIWTVLHPLAQALIYAVVLSEILGSRLGAGDKPAAYPIYLLAGMAAWNLFSEILIRCLGIFTEYAGTIRKIAFPRLCLPVIVFGGAVINHLLLLAAIGVIFVFFGHYPSITWLYIPLGLLLIALFAFGLGMLLAIFNVFTRDVAQVVAIVLQLWFWLTPIVYVETALPEYVRQYMQWNPMAPLVKFYQSVLLYHQTPDFVSLIVPALFFAALAVLALAMFRRASSDVVDAL